LQAQTVANFFLAFEHELPIIPVLNKIDLKNAQPEAVMEQLESLFDIQPETVLKVSAKNGIGIDELLETVIKRIPPPKGMGV
jgi:translation elongation factor EF-4